MPPPSRPSMALTLTLPIRPDPSSRTPTHHLRPITINNTHQTRQASTTRRHRKLNNIPPAPLQGGPHLPTGSSGKSRTARSPLPPLAHILHNPPSSAPNVYHTPPKFLPKDDIRWKLYEQQQAAQGKNDETTQTSAKAIDEKSEEGFDPNDPRLPPAVHKPYKKRYHLLPEQIAEIRRLRQEDDSKWTRKRLAERFQCTQFFVAMVVHASEGRKKMLREQLESWEEWARRKNPAILKIQAERRKRRELWREEV